MRELGPMSDLAPESPLRGVPGGAAKEVDSRSLWRQISGSMNRVKLVVLLIVLFLCVSAHGAEPFKFRGYYVTFMRMPVMGLPEWKEAIDCFAEDDINVLILWTAGGFRSKKFPITWQYNQDHANIRNDFARELIDYAHTNNIRPARVHAVRL